MRATTSRTPMSQQDTRNSRIRHIVRAIASRTSAFRATASNEDDHQQDNRVQDTREGVPTLRETTRATASQQDTREGCPYITRRPRVRPRGYAPTIHEVA